jgi:hypothetical protein
MRLSHKALPRSRIAGSKIFLYNALSMSSLEQVHVFLQDNKQDTFQLETAVANLMSQRQYQLVSNIALHLIKQNSTHVSSNVMLSGLLAAGSAGSPDAMLDILNAWKKDRIVDLDILSALIHGFMVADQQRNAYAVLGRWLELSLEAYSSTAGDALETQHLLKYLTSIQSSARLERSTLLQTCPEMTNAVSFERSLYAHGVDTRTFQANTLDWSVINTRKKIPLVVWVVLLRGFAVRGAFGKAIQALTFINTFYRIEMSHPSLPIESYGNIVLHATHPIPPTSDALLLRLCHFYALQAATLAQTQAQNRGSSGPDNAIGHILLVMKGMLMEVDLMMQSVILRMSSGDEVLKLGYHVVRSLPTNYDDARVILNECIITLCRQQHEDQACKLLSEFMSACRQHGLSMPVESIAELIDVLTSRGRVNQALELWELVKEQQMGRRLYDAICRAFTQAGEVQKLAQLMMDESRKSRKVT